MGERRRCRNSSRLSRGPACSSQLESTRHAGRIAGTMANSMDDNLGSGDLVENQIGIRRYHHASNDWVFCAPAHIGMKQEKIDDRLHARLNAPLVMLDMVEDCVEFGKRRKGVAEPHRPRLDHTARIWSSVANSPRAAAAFEAAIAARSSGESATGGSSSVPASRSTTRAILS